MASYRIKKKALTKRGELREAKRLRHNRIFWRSVKRLNRKVMAYAAKQGWKRGEYVVYPSAIKDPATGDPFTQTDNGAVQMELTLKIDKAPVTADSVVMTSPQGSVRRFMEMWRMQIYGIAGTAQ